MMWFDKHNSMALYVDKREVPEMRCCDGRRFKVEPDMLADFRCLPFSDKSFKLICWDPPHLIRVGDDAYMAVKYGKLTEDWEKVLHDGFSELMRVLDDYGTLIFKWNEYQIPTSKVIAAIGHQPLFGHISGRKSMTHWMTFMKFPDQPPA